MYTANRDSLQKRRIVLKFFIFSIFLFSINTFAQFNYEETIGTVNAASDTQEKAQSKVWKYGGYWWAVIPVDAGGGDPSGAYLWRLNSSSWSWTELFRLSTRTNVQADTKAVNNITYILLFDKDNEDAEFVRIQYSGSSYSIITGGPGVEITIALDNGVELATIDVDSNNKVWLASDEKVGSNDASIHVRYSEGFDYDVWTLATTLATDAEHDDICAITAFTTFGVHKIGVLWSNQHDDDFHFSYRIDSDDPATWQSPETASPDQSGSFSDDHINFAVSSNGIIYAAVKTSYDDSRTTIAILERESGGTWNVHSVTNSGATRPIALLDDSNNEIYVFYTADIKNNDDIVYKYASTSSFSFSQTKTLDNSFLFNDVTSTKQTFSGDVVLLYTRDTDRWYGKIEGTEELLPVELVSFGGILNGNNVELRWQTETEIENYGFTIERIINDVSDWSSIAFVPGNGNSNSPKAYNHSDYDIRETGTYNYRLKQIDNDGTYSYSDIVSVEVGLPYDYNLSQNYPNPFNPTTRINFSIPERQIVTIRVYNILGEIVSVLLNEIREPGSYSLTFDAYNLPGGVYFYSITAGSFTASYKMSVLK
ncbi:MAG: T9SS type A sorting domain-containing protein [Ignavibacteria bacterium]|jgi:hypothetical protein